MPNPGLILRARLVLPVGQRPIPNGAVALRGNRVLAVGPFPAIQKTHPGAVLDAGDHILLPGLVNAHCHLDYTDMVGSIAPTRSFVDWIKSITTLKAGWSYSEFAASWLHGARMLLQTGTTTVGDIEAVPELLPEVWSSTPLRVVSFLEMTGVRSRRDPRAILQEALAQIQRLSPGPGTARLSPHAPYSTPPELLQLTAQLARRHRWRRTTHVAESAEEYRMFTRADGAMYHWLARNERDMTDCGSHTPVQHLERHGCLGPDLLAVHLNYLGPGDAQCLARHGVWVVHCPRSHAYFRHAPFPFRQLTRHKVPVCLATDSLATVNCSRGALPQLDLLAEVRAFARQYPDVSPRKLLAMITLHAAQALDWAGRIGELTAGAFADLILVPFTGRPADAYAAVVHHEGPVNGSMIDGQWALPPPHLSFVQR